VFQTRTANSEKTGLTYWMGRVLSRHSKLRGELRADLVHDVRVALRRCTLIAEVMKQLDPGGDWKTLRRTGRELFKQLGELRDTQALLEWLERLALPGDESVPLLAEFLKTKYERDQSAAEKSVRDFDRKKWRESEKELNGHYRHVLADRRACESLVYRMWESVRDLHRSAQKSRSRIGYHRLRIGIKKFRYGVENFLPSLYAGWVAELKSLQDLLGEVHDLDVLAQVIVKDKRLSPEVHAAWLLRIEVERSSRLRRYHEKMSGQNSPLLTWREALPAERELRSTGLAELGEWAYFISPDLPRVRRVARLAVQLYDGLSNCKLISHDLNTDQRFVLRAAALLEEVGRFKKNKAHHKESYRMIRRFHPPPGWSKRDMELTALVARFHRRGLPRPDHKALKSFEPAVQQSVVLLAAILRLANAFHAKSYRAVRRLEVENSSGIILVRAWGLPDSDPLTAKLAEARRLLEFAAHHPIRVLAPSARIASPQLMKPVQRSDAA
jgi:CHAD domain-containing protein